MKQVYRGSRDIQGNQGYGRILPKCTFKLDMGNGAKGIHIPISPLPPFPRSFVCPSYVFGFLVAQPSGSLACLKLFGVFWLDFHLTQCARVPSVPMLVVFQCL